MYHHEIQYESAKILNMILKNVIFAQSVLFLEECEVYLQQTDVPHSYLSLTLKSQRYYYFSIIREKKLNLAYYNILDRYSRILPGPK